jgi:competence protein ComFC
LNSSASFFKFYKIIWGLLDYIYPPQCVGCGKYGERICENCKQDIRIIKPPLCYLCGIQLTKEGVCMTCQNEKPVFDRLRSIAVYQGSLRKAVHCLKYRRDVSLGVYLARPMIELFRKLQWEVDIIVPIPLGYTRLKERGYNQSSLLAYPIALATSTRYEPKALRRTRETESQVELTLEARKQNVYGAFLGVSKYAYRKRILLVDDVATSCATLNACADALLSAGADCVYALTLARAGLISN